MAALNLSRPMTSTISDYRRHRSQICIAPESAIPCVSFEAARANSAELFQADNERDPQALCCDPFAHPAIAVPNNHQTVRLQVYAVSRKSQKGVGVARDRPTSYPHECEHPTCPRCNRLMQLVFVEEEYPGYSRRTFACQSCDGTMTAWVPALKQARHSHRL